MTKLVSADGGDARPLKRIAQDIWPARAYVLGNGAGQPGKTRAALARC